MKDTDIALRILLQVGAWGEKSSKSDGDLVPMMDNSKMEEGISSVKEKLRVLGMGSNSCQTRMSRGRLKLIALIGRELFGRLSDFNVEVGN